jgi:glycosyltransferase involved in cell wall biosynthesis
MKVGIDARLLSRPLSGIGRYTLEMCRALSTQSNITLYLYSPAPIRGDYLLGLESTNIKTGNLNNGLLRQFWSESFLPLWAKKDEVDVFWGPAHRLPYCLPRNIARVVTIHDLVWKYAADTMRPFSRLLERYQMPLAVRLADVVVADSNATADAVREEFFIDSNKLSVVTLGANLHEETASFKLLNQFGINHQYFLFVGTLEPRKNLTRLLTAYSQLEESLKEQTMLVIVGGKGWGGIDLNEMITDLGLLNHVRLLGYVDELALATLYSNAQFLTMPSIYEGFGLPLIEAMVHGVPALTSNNSSMPEVVGDAGLLVDALDVSSIMNGLKVLITNQDLRGKLAANAKVNAARFNWDESARKLILVFEQAISIRKSHLS